MMSVASSVMIAFGSSSKKSKTRPASIATVASSSAINIPASARTMLEKSAPPQTPPLLSPSTMSSDSYDSLDEEEALPSVPVRTAAVTGGDVHPRRLSQQFFFPNQTKFESAVPQVVRARDIYLKDHPIVEGAYAEYEALYNCDSLMTKDGRHMVRLLSPSAGAAVVAGDVRARRQSQQFFFPNQTKFESAVPQVIRARDIHLKDHPIVEGAYAEYEALYNADSLMTKDGRHMVRLL